MTPEIITVGETMATLRLEHAASLNPTVSLSVAGSEGNVAVGLARLGHRVRWVSAVGDDAVGRLVTRAYAAEMVDISAVRVDPAAPTGILVSEQRLPGIARVDYHRTGSAGSAISSADVLSALAEAPRIVHVSGITPALSPAAAEAVGTAVTEGRRQGALVSLDVNYRSRLWSTEEASAALTPLLNEVDVLIADPDELAVLLPSGDEPTRVKRLLELGLSAVVVKRGAQGASVWTGGERVDRPARTVKTIDSIGAGDAFVAGYLSATLDGLDVGARLERANVAGAFAVSSTGDWEGLPRRAELGLLDQADGDVLR